MSTIINTQSVTVEQLITPIGVGIHNNSSPSLLPYAASLAYDEVIPGSLFVGNGVSWVNVADGSANNYVVGPNTSTVNNLCTFNNTEGNLISDSGISSSNIVQANSTSTNGNLVMYNGISGRSIQDSGISPSALVSGPGSSVSGDIVTFNGTTGKILQDSGYKLSSVDIVGVTFTGTNIPNFSGIVQIQQIYNGVYHVNTIVISGMGGTSTANPSSWTCPAATIPSNYLPLGTLVFLGGTSTSFLNIYLTLNSDGSITITNPNPAGAYTISNVSAIYNT